MGIHDARNCGDHEGISRLPPAAGSFSQSRPDVYGSRERLPAGKRSYGELWRGSAAGSQDWKETDVAFAGLTPSPALSDRVSAIIMLTGDSGNPVMKCSSIDQTGFRQVRIHVIADVLRQGQGSAARTCGAADRGLWQCGMQ